MSYLLLSFLLGSARSVRVRVGPPAIWGWLGVGSLSLKLSNATPSLETTAFWLIIDGGSNEMFAQVGFQTILLVYLQIHTCIYIERVPGGRRWVGLWCGVGWVGFFFPKKKSSARLVYCAWECRALPSLLTSRLDGYDMICRLCIHECIMCRNSHGCSLFTFAPRS